MTVDNCQTPSVPEPQRDGGSRRLTERAKSHNFNVFCDKNHIFVKNNVNKVDF